MLNNKTRMGSIQKFVASFNEAIATNGVYFWGKLWQLAATANGRIHDDTGNDWLGSRDSGAGRTPI